MRSAEMCCGCLQLLLHAVGLKAGVVGANTAAPLHLLVALLLSEMLLLLLVWVRVLGAGAAAAASAASNVVTRDAAAGVIQSNLVWPPLLSCWVRWYDHESGIVVTRA
jgi:hypothetical protein